MIDSKDKYTQYSDNETIGTTTSDSRKQPTQN